MFFPLFQQYNVSDKDIDMPDGYPKPNSLSEEQQAEIVLRFQNGNNFFYDPTVETGDDIGEPVNYGGEDSGSESIATSSVLILSCLMMLVKMLL